MIIEIDDKLEGKERRRQLSLQPLLYAFEKFDNKKDVAKFLGISLRTLTDCMRYYPDLMKYKAAKPWFMKTWSEEKIENYFNANKNYLEGQTRRFYNAWGSNRSSGSSESITEHSGQNNRQDSNL